MKGKRLHGFLVSLLKCCIVLYALIQLLNLIISYLGLDNMLNSTNGGQGLFTWCFVMISSLVLRLKQFYRILLYYTFTMQVLLIYDYQIGLPIETETLFIIYAVIALIFLIIAIVSYFKTRNKNEEYGEKWYDGSMIVALKFLPFVLAAFSITVTLLSLFNFEEISPVISTIASCSILDIIYIYISSLVFYFCSYHRVFLFYLLVNVLLSTYHWYYGLPSEIILPLYVSLIIFSIICFILLYIHVKCNKKIAPATIG